MSMEKQKSLLESHTLRGSEDSPGAALLTFINKLKQKDNPFLPEHVSKLDRQEEFPSKAIDLLNEFGLNRYYIPAKYGGMWTNCVDIIQLWRVVARLDLTAAVAHGKTFLGSICVWLEDDFKKSQNLAKKVSDGISVAWGLTERHHGSDLLSGELVAKQSGDGWYLSGEKWLINNATRSKVICILARLENRAGARGFSCFLVDKQLLPPHAYSHLPKELTHGIRGADISGIKFEKAYLPEDALVGRGGQGVELVLTSLQITRTLCVGLSLGAAEQALYLAVNFAKGHRLYNRFLIDLPLARRSIGESAAKLIVAEVVSLVCGRHIHSLPEEMSVVSAICKSTVPAIVEEIISQTGELLGARALLTKQYADGMFQKIERDHRIVPIFDGSTVVNQSSLISQFPLLVKAYNKGACETTGILKSTSLFSPVEALDLPKLALLSPNGCSMVQSLPSLTSRIKQSCEKNILSENILTLSEKLLKLTELLIKQMASCPSMARGSSESAYALARRYGLCFSGTACLQAWLNSSDNPHAKSSKLWEGGLWLEASLKYIVDCLDPGTEDLKIYDQVTEEVILGGRIDSFSLLDM